VHILNNHSTHSKFAILKSDSTIAWLIWEIELWVDLLLDMVDILKVSAITILHWKVSGELIYMGKWVTCWLIWEIELWVDLLLDMVDILKVSAITILRWKVSGELTCTGNWVASWLIWGSEWHVDLYGKLSGKLTCCSTWYTFSKSALQSFTWEIE